MVGGHAAVQNTVIHDAEKLVQRFLAVNELVVDVKEFARPLVGLPDGPSSVLVACFCTRGSVRDGLLVRLAHNIGAGVDGRGSKILAGGVSWRRNYTLFDITVATGDDDLELLVGVACVDQVVQGYRPTPENTLDIGHTGGVRALAAGEDAGIALEENVETLTGLPAGARGGTCCNIVRFQEGESEVVICAAHVLAYWWGKTCDAAHLLDFFSLLKMGA